MVGLSAVPAYISNTWASCHMRVLQADVAAEAGWQKAEVLLKAACRGQAALMPSAAQRAEARLPVTKATPFVRLG